MTSDFGYWRLCSEISTFLLAESLQSEVTTQVVTFEQTSKNCVSDPDPGFNWVSGSGSGSRQAKTPQKNEEIHFMF
jgi:hypothetical protein